MKTVLFATMLTLALVGCGSANTLSATSALPSSVSAKGAMMDGNRLSANETAQALAIVKNSQESSTPDFTRKVTNVKFTRTAMPTLIQFTATVVTVGFSGHRLTTVVTGVVDLKAAKLLSLKNAGKN